MLNPLRKLEFWKKHVTPKDLDELYDRVNLLSTMTGVAGTQVTTSPAGITIKGGGQGGGRAKLYEVQSSATGDGVYNCYEQLIDATDWTSTTEVDKVVDKNTTSVEVWNAVENYIYTPFAEALNATSRMIGWEMTDDAGNKRIVGFPVMPMMIRLAYTQEAATSDTKISVKLADFQGVASGSAFDVNCIIYNGSALNEAVPRLVVDHPIWVINIWGLWYALTIFQASEDCDCYEAP
jgi:hypothetical protein